METPSHKYIESLQKPNNSNFQGKQKTVKQTFTLVVRG